MSKEDIRALKIFAKYAIGSLLIGGMVSGLLVHFGASVIGALGVGVGVAGWQIVGSILMGNEWDARDKKLNDNEN